ncbi:phytoene desaturase family protein [Actinacidiphila acidipaludis]|uniref:NAD(P)/FAD-dependent oxidoreductase n=1 Tax=Actinacidiphila acidipaludis TaxID=2873382 RepID=A0ABS7Q0A4_9ACTN|nr:NAD(P)/FAD-dependent oxidoreductase [Streptomyces acidipaludis]MBY8876561.1 NAD(P)/FAD-dependent oxidoreductase [Streptomyces acidipaludis]
MARIAVIGAGMASMATAARLATGGHTVVVHERAETHGGGLGLLSRDGFRFDTGPGVLLLPAVQRDLFVKTGKAALEDVVDLVQVDPAVRHLLADGTAVALPNASRSGVVEALDAAFGPGSGERWSQVMVRAREVWEATRRPLLEDVLHDPAAQAADPYPAAVRRGLFRRAGTSGLAGVAARELGGGGLGALLESWALAYGLDPRHAPASASVLAYVEQTFGVWYPRGGMRALADALYERCLERRVEFRFGTAVTGLLVEDGRAAGLELAGGSRTPADVVVAGAPLPALYRDGVLPPEGPGAPFPGPAGEPGRCVVHLALRGPRPEGTAHRTVVHPAERAAEYAWVFGERRGDALPPAGGLTVTVLRPDDPATRPDDGHEAVTLVATVPCHTADGTGSAGGTGTATGTGTGLDWSSPGLAGAVAARMAEAAEAAVPGLRERELWRVVRTPADTASQTGAPGGSVPAPALAGAGGALLRPANRSAVPGLYRVGGWAHPGGGLPHAGMSGAIVADLVAGGPGGSR